MKTVQIKIENLKCQGCASTIIKGLQKFDEVEKVNVNIEKSIVEIIYHDEQEDIEKYKKKLSSLGYPEYGNNNVVSIAKSYVSCAMGRVNK